ncbi:MAG: hypothetical protein EZS28_001045, partial [Streblomastix strix]
MEDTRILQSQGFQVRRDQNSHVYLVSSQGLGILAAKLWKIDDFSQDGWKQLGAVKGEQNPFVVRYVEAKKVENAMIVLMDFVNYKSLDYVIEQGKDLPPGTVRAILKQLLEGVRLMHKQGIVHGNITSENILLHCSPGSERVILKITNIGLTKKPQIISYTNAKLIRGIFPNLAPEVIIGNGLTDSKIDVWSVGIIAHQLVAHEFPYKVQTFQELQNFMIAKKLDRYPQIKDDQLWNLITQMLSFDRKERISATEALNHEFFTGEKADEEISINAFRLAQAAQKALQKGDKNINQYDLDASFTFPYTDAKELINKDPEQEMKIIQNKFNLPLLYATGHKTTHVLDTLLDHLDESGDLDVSYFASVLTVPNDELFAPMNITSVFPEVHFCAVIAHLDQYSNIILEPIASEPSPDHFTMIIRYHKQDLDTLRPYFDDEAQCYDDMLIQNARDLAYIGSGPNPNGCCTIFLTSSTLTLEAAIQQGLLSDLQSKFEITKSLIDSIQQAHESVHFGFDLRPSSILCTNRKGGLSVSLIGYYGQENILASHPDCSRIQLDSYWTAPELILQTQPRRRNASPNSNPNMSPSPSASSFQAFSPSIKPPSPPPSQSSLNALSPSIKPTQPPPSIQLIIKQPSAYPPFPSMTPIPSPTISTHSLTSTPNSTQTGFMVKPTKASDIYALGMLILNIYEKSPEAKELVSNAKRNTAQVRCNINSLFIVDPQNQSDQGFPFVKIETEKCISKIPINQNQVSQQDDSISSMRQAVAVPRKSLTPAFFAALEAVVPAVPEEMLLDANNLIKQLSNNNLIIHSLEFPSTIISKISLQILFGKGIKVNNFAQQIVNLNISSDDSRYNAAIDALIYFKDQTENLKTKPKIKLNYESNQYTPGDANTCGFYCDREDLFQTQISSDNLLTESSKLIANIREGKSKPEFAEEIIRNGQIAKQIPRFIITQSSKARLDIVIHALNSGIPLLIQGPTSASKSLTAQVASVGLYGQFPLIYALSVQTEVGDLLGRKMLRRKGTSMLSYVPGVLAEAYEKGRVLLLTGFDLCPPKVISSILTALDGNTIEIEGRKIIRHQNFRIIATLNGETDGFTPQQRIIITSEILARFHTISFPLMSREECNDIFNQLIQKFYPQYEKESIQIADIHKSVENYYASDQRKDKSRGSAAMTLRNFSYAIDLMVLEKLKPRDACTIAYLAQIPTADRTQFNDYIDKLGQSDNFQKLRDEITMVATEMHIHPHPLFIDAAVYAIDAARNGLHVLLEGPSGCGLSTLARFVAKFCTKETARERRIVVPEVLLGPESTVKNIIGSFKSQEMKSNETDMTKLIKWENGPLLIAAESGTPVILDRIDEAKAQVTERLNPILEKNARRDQTPFLVPEKVEFTEQHVAQGFVVIATLTTNPNRQGQTISLALRNRFVTIAVDPPELSDQLRTLIAQTDISKVAEKMKLIN